MEEVNVDHKQSQEVSCTVSRSRRTHTAVNNAQKTRRLTRKSNSGKWTHREILFLNPKRLRSTRKAVTIVYKFNKLLINNSS